LDIDGRLYDSKAIVGAAHGYEFPLAGPLRTGDFSGGEATVTRKLEELGFTVRRLPATRSGPNASLKLKPGAIYTREALGDLFDIHDATLNTGVFRPKAYHSVWLFVTRDKTPDRTQYKDFLDGDVLHWQGQTSGRTDPMIIEHQQRGLELLLFYREWKYEHEHAGFRYEGRFLYVSHSGSNPTSFILHRVPSDLETEATWLEQTEPFDPKDIGDGRTRILREIVRRQGQRSFRQKLLSAYEGRCAISGCEVEEVLEAAHIMPFMGEVTNHVANGLLLRADLHTLFDLHLITIDTSNFSVLISDRLRGSLYEEMAGKPLRLPRVQTLRPNRNALDLHRSGG